MSSKYKFRNQEKLYFITFTVVDWIDVFIRNEYKDILLDDIRYNQLNKGLEVYAWCLMTSHIHMIIGSKGEKLAVIMQGLKSVSSRKIGRAILDNSPESRKEWMLKMFKCAGERNKHKGSYQFWIEGNHPIELSDNEMMDQKLDYIHNNPVEAGFVDKAEEYVYSSARDYSGSKGLLDIKFIE